MGNGTKLFIFKKLSVKLSAHGTEICANFLAKLFV